MKQAIALSVILVFIVALIAYAGGDYILRSLLEEGDDLDSAQIAEILVMPRHLNDVLTANSEPLIPPVDMVWFDPSGEYGLILHITDTIRTTRFRMGSYKKAAGK